jgi:predicted dehydrogenase
MRFIPVRRLLRELVADGFLGELRLVTASVVVDFGTDPAINVYYWNWLSQRALGGGITRASFLSHHLDLLRFTFGDIADIGARTATAITERPVRADRSVREASPDMEMRPVDTEDTVAACGTFVGGAPFTVAATWSVHHPSGIRVEAYGSEGTLVLEPGATPFEGRVLAARVDEPGLREVPVPERFALPVAGSGVGSLFHALAADVVRHVGDPAYEHVHATFEDGVATLELADAIVG